MTSRLLRSLSKIMTALLLGVMCLHASAQARALDGYYQEALNTLKTVQQDGPQTIELADQAVLHLPAGFSFVPGEAAQNFLLATGNATSSMPLGLILHNRISEGFIIVGFEPSGYIREGDATTWNAQQLLDKLQSCIAQNNVQRQAHGLSRIDMLGWVEKPIYNARQHQLIWSVALHEQDKPRSDAQAINYNAYILGREGYLSLNLVTQVRLITKEKNLIQQLLNATAFKQGKSYTDFNPQSDQQSMQNMSALISVVAAPPKKLSQPSLWDEACTLLQQYWLWIILALALVTLLWHKQHAHGKPGLHA